MTRRSGRKAGLGGRGIVLVDEYARRAGLDPASVAEMLESGRVEGLVDEHGRAHSLFKDVLPTAQQLRDWGLTPSLDYSPEDFASFDVDDAHDDDIDDADDEDGSDSGQHWIRW